MPTLVEVPNLGKIEFPDGMSHDDITSSIKNLLSKKGGEQTNENAKSKSDQGPRSQGDAQRTLNGKVNSALPDRTQASDQPRPQDQGQSQRGDNADQGLIATTTEGGEKNAKQENAKAEDGYGSQVRKEDGQGIRGQVPAGDKEEVKDETSGVQPPAQGFIERIKEDPLAALESAGESAARGLIGLKAGEAVGKAAGKLALRAIARDAAGTVAAAVAAPGAIAETAATGGLGALAVPAIEMGAFAAGTYVADKAVDFVEHLVGIDDSVEEAKAKNPELAQAASIATMVPMAASSIKNLAGMGVKEATKKVIGGAIGGAAFEPVRYGVESALKAVTGSEQEVSPITIESELESAITGGILSAHGYKQIRDNVGPATAEAALKTKTDATIENEGIKKQEAGGVSTEQGEPSVGKTEGETKEGTAQREGEGEKEVRIGAAAWRNARTGAIYHGADHEAAVEAAKRDAQDPENKDKVAAGDLPTTDTTKPENRETPEFGFITTDGKFVSRDQAEQIASNSGQLRGEKARDLLHSHEVEKDWHKGQVQEGEVRRLPGAASAGEFDRNRVANAAEVLKSFEIAGQPLDLNNTKDYLKWRDAYRRDYEKGTFENKSQLEAIYQQAHEVNDLRKEGIPIPAALDQIGGKRRSSVDKIANKNADINEKRKSMGLPELMPMAGRTQDSIWQEALYRIESSNGQYTENLLSELKANPNRAINGVEQAALSHKIAEVAHERDMILDRASKATDPSIKADLDNQLRKVEGDIDVLSKISQKAGNTWSDAGRMRAAIIANDYSLPNLLNRKRKAVGGRELSPEEIKEAGEEADAFKKKSEEVKKAEEARITGNQDEDIGEHIGEGIKEHKKTATKREKGQEKNGNDLVAKFTEQLLGRKEDPTKLGSTIRNLAKAVARKRLEDEEAFRGRKLTDDEAKAVTKTRDVVNDVHKIVTDQIGNDWAIKQTRDAISGYGIFKNPPKTYLSQAMSRIIGENRNIGKIEDIIQGLAPKKTGAQRMAPGPNERMLIKRVNELARKFNVKAEDPEKQLATALNSAKTRAMNLIAELEEIYRQGRPLKEVESRIAQEDPELNDLKGEILGLRNLIEEKYGKREVPYEQKVKAMESVYDKLIELYQKEIKSGEISGTSSKGEKITSEKLEHQREVLKNLRQERSLIRAADSLRIEQAKMVKAQNRLDQIARILRGEEKDQKTGQMFGPESEPVTAIEKAVAEAERALKEFRDSKKKSPQQKEIDRLLERLENAEERLARLQSGEKKISGKDQSVLNEEQQKVKDEIDSINNQIKEYQEANKTRKTEEERMEAFLVKQVENKRKILEAGKIEPKQKKVQPTSPRREELQREFSDLSKQISDTDWFKARKEAVALQAYKTRTDRAIEDAKRRLAEGDFSKAERKETKLDEEARKKRLELQELKDKIQQNITLKEYENRTNVEKALDVSVKFKKFAVLSYLSSITKLGSSSLAIPLLKLPSEAVGYALGKTPLFREIYRKARQEAGGRIDKDIQIYAKGFFQGIKEFKKIAFEMKRSDLDLEYGDGSLIPLGALDRPAKIHEAIKNPTKLANYKVAYERYLDWAKREGITIDDEVKAKAGIEAYKEANASIFMRDSGLVNKFNLFVTTLRKSDSPRQRALGLAFQEMLPIVKIPTNIIKEAFEYQFGTLTGGAKLIKEMNKGLENISPEDADMILRQIKKGSVGLMGLAIGAALPEFFGGFYRKGADKDEEGPDYGGIKIGSQIIPKQLLHHPAFVPFQIGATIRKVWEEAADNNENLGDDAMTIARGAWEAQLGLLEELPFLSFSRNLGKYLDPTRPEETIGEIAKSNIPGFIQEFAQYLDRDEDGKVIKRKPEDILQHIELGIPIARQQVQEK